MKLSYIGIAGFVAVALAFSSPVFASTAFTVTGIVDVQLTKSVVNITATKASSDVADEVLNENIPYTVSKTTTYWKYVRDKHNKVVLVKTSLGQVRFGQEVVVKGVKSGDTFKVSKLIINDRSFSITGTISGVDHDNDTIEVLVKTSTYKQAGIKGTYVTMKYISSTKCWESSKEVGCSDITNDNQKIKVEGGVTGTENTYNLTKVWSKY